MIRVANLQHDSVLLLGVHQLEVLHGGHRDAAIEVQNVGAHLLVPARRLVDQVDQVPEVAVLHTAQHVISRGGGRRSCGRTAAAVLPLYYVSALIETCQENQPREDSRGAVLDLATPLASCAVLASPTRWRRTLQHPSRSERLHLKQFAQVEH